ncbi:MAG: GntR family transcriptional regulator [Planctomycetes bacterium]|nr:GntR family transcriptional regulator [Planctomycetota bacterium]
MPLPTIGLDLANDTDGRSKYKMLRDHLVAQMEEGRLAPGQALPTEQTLAESIGVSRSTVRQALGMLEREGLVRREQGRGTFVHDEAPRRLHKKSDLFALVVPETRTGFYPSLLHNYELAVRKHNCQAVFCSTNNSIDRQGSVILQLIDQKVAGVAINPTTGSPAPAYQIRQLQEHHIPVVFCHRGVEGVQAPLLALPYEKIGHLAGKKIAEAGHRRIAYFSSYESPSCVRYLEGLRAGLELSEPNANRYLETWHGQSEAPDSQSTELDLLQALEAMMSRPDRPTAIFATFDSLAEMIYLHLNSLGIRVPEDVSLVGVGGVWREGAIIRRLTSLVVDEAETARRAVELLVEIRDGQRFANDNEQIEIPMGISDGETLGPAPRNNR